MNSTTISNLVEKNFDLAMKATEKHDDDAFKRKCKNLVILVRLEAREYIDQCEAAKHELLAALRTIKKAEYVGITSLLTGRWIADLQKRVDDAEERVFYHGMLTAAILDRWQMAGATLKELCNLCNRDYNKLMTELATNEHKDWFSTLVAAHNIDYTLTTLFRDMLSYTMRNTSKGQAILRDGVDLLFPGLMDNAMHMVADEYCKQNMLDIDDYNPV